MSTELLEKKVAELTERVAALEADFHRAPRGAWRELAGSQVDDELFREAVRLGAEWREKANTESK